MFDLPSIFLTIVAAINIVVVFFIYWRRTRDLTTTTFSLLVVSLSFWSLAIFLYRIIDDPSTALTLMNLSYASALLLAAAFYCFSVAFPDNKALTRTHVAFVAWITGIFTVLVLWPHFLGVSITYHAWGKETLLNPLGYYAFALVFLYLFVGGHVRLWIKYLREKGTVRLQLFFLAVGGTISGLVGMFFNLLLPSPFFHNFQYIWLGPVFTFLYAVVIVYSIFRHRLFNVKTILAELFVFSLWIFIFLRTLLANEASERIMNVGLLAATVAIGIFLIRSVDREVEQRDLIQKQEQELEVVNKQQEGLLHFISHEIKGYLTKNEAGFSAIASGDFGEVSAPLKHMSEEALADTRKGVDTVMNILDASNLKKGTVTYVKKPFDFAKAVGDVVTDLTQAAKEKGITLEFHKPVDGSFAIVGDEEKLRRHVIRNMIDNSIKYTLHGEITVDLARTDSVIRLTISDTGVGITKEDMARLFTEGGRGADSIKVNVHSTGYGLFIAKAVVEAHGGKIWAESEGKDKGSRFIVELPAAK